MSAITNYLNELYFYEEIYYIDESFASWAKQIASKKIIDKLTLAAQHKDIKMVEKIMSAVPKVSTEKLLKIGKKAHKDFKQAYIATKKEVSKKFINLSGQKLEYLALALTPFIVTSKDIKNAAKEKVAQLKQKAKEPQFKKFGAEGFVGMLFLLLIGGAFAAASFATLTMFPLLVGIVIAGFAMLLMLEGAAA